MEQDYDTAFALFNKAAAQGLPRAQFFLGLMYADRKGVPQDDRLAVGWYQKLSIRNI